MSRLILISKNLAPQTHELGAGWTTIGRADGNSFQIIENSISGRHCEVKMDGEELLARDLLSTNGIFINGKKVLEGKLKNGEILRVGDVELRFENSSSTDSPGTSFISKMLVMNSQNLSAPKNLDAPKSVSEIKIAPQKSAAAKFHILFVDDSMAFLEMFGGVCAEYSNGDWQIHTAPGADRALQILQDQKMNLVVLDIGMPTLDGLQLLSILRRRSPDLKIAVLTGKATEARRADALAGGADLYLEKPLTADGMKSVFNILNTLVSWTEQTETAVLKNPALEE